MEKIKLRINKIGHVLLIQEGSEKVSEGMETLLARESNVTFDADKKRWIIKDQDGGNIGREEGYRSRMQAVHGELRLLNDSLESGEHDVQSLGFKMETTVVKPHKKEK